MVSSPGHAPGMKLPPHEPLSAVFMQVPEPELIVQVFLTQHWMLVGPGQ